MNKKIEGIKKVSLLRAYMFSLLCDGTKFKLKQQGGIDFKVNYPVIDSTLYKCEKITIGSNVIIHSNLERQWYLDVCEPEKVEAKFIVVAFVTLKAKVKNIKLIGTFCVLGEIKKDSDSSPDLLMTGKKHNKIALVCVDALETVG